MHGLILPLVLQALLFSHQAAAQSCYNDAYGRRYCNNYYLSTGARVGIAIGSLVLFCLFLSLCMLRRRRMMAARNAILLQNQHSQQTAGVNGQWVPPPGGSHNTYPMQPNNTGYGGAQPFQPGYIGNYAPPPGGPDVAKEYDTNPNNIQRPTQAYNPDQPYHSTTPAPAAPGTYNAANDPPTYSGYSAPSGPPPGIHSQPVTDNPYYSPPNTTKT